MMLAFDRSCGCEVCRRGIAVVDGTELSDEARREAEHLAMCLIRLAGDTAKRMYRAGIPVDERFRAVRAGTAAAIEAIAALEEEELQRR